MKLMLSTLLIISLFLSSSLSAQTVYITKTGKKYHTTSCRYLHSSKIPIACSDATRNYGACSVCAPSCSGEAVQESSSSSTTSTPSSTAVQCSATTQSGSRCKRRTTNASGQCWQHE